MGVRQRHKHLRLRKHAASHSEHEMLEHDPPLSPRDEAIFLLHVAAEVEHALLTQYLYAAYSLKSKDDLPEERRAQVRAWKHTLLGIAREEMGHLITVQNLLRLIGGPLTLNREDYPFRTGLYPFSFRLEPLSKLSLAKYVVAEMPHLSEPSEEIEEIKSRAAGDEPVPINRVGSLYSRLHSIFSQPTDDAEMHLSDTDFLTDVSTYQAHYDDWGNGDSVLVLAINNRAEALKVIEELAEQGEGLFDAEQAPSHYQRFLSIYREFPEPGDWQPTNAVPRNPSTGTAPQDVPDLEAGRITHLPTRHWAQLANMRYRLLLSYLLHFLQIPGALIDSNGNNTPQGYLQKWTFDEMRRISQLAGILAKMPRKEGGEDSSERAAAPFELPYTLKLSDREPDRWRQHIDVLDASVTLVHHMRHRHDQDDPFLLDLVASDREAQRIARAVAEGEELHVPTGSFSKVVRILDDAVRGFPIGAHHNFWRDCTRDEFIAKSIFGHPLIATRPDGTFDPDASNLIKALRGEPPFDSNPEGFPRMPAEHPPIRPEQIAFIHNWIAQGCPDDTPPNQIGTSGEHPPAIS